MHFVHTSNAISWASLIYYADLAGQSAAIIALDTFSVNIRIQFLVLRTSLRAQRGHLKSAIQQEAMSGKKYDPSFCLVFVCL
jgi:hypothetical protein